MVLKLKLKLKESDEPSKKRKQNYVVGIFKLLSQFVKKMKLFLCKRTIRTIKENKQQIERRGDLFKSKEPLAPSLQKRLNKLQTRSRTLVARLQRLKSLSAEQRKFLIFYIMLEHFKVDLDPVLNPSANTKQTLQDLGKSYKRIVSENLPELVAHVRSGEFAKFDLDKDFVSFFFDAITEHQQFAEVRDSVEKILEKRINKIGRSKTIKLKKKDKVKLLSQHKIKRPTPAAEGASERSYSPQEAVGSDAEPAPDQSGSEGASGAPAPVTKKIQKPRQQLEKNRLLEERLNAPRAERSEFKKTGRNKAKAIKEGRMPRQQERKAPWQDKRGPEREQPRPQVAAQREPSRRTDAPATAARSAPFPKPLPELHPSWKAKQDLKQQEKQALSAFQGTKKKLC